MCHVGNVFQERHSRELEEVKKAGHDALGVVVEQYKVGQ